MTRRAGSLITAMLLAFMAGCPTVSVDPDGTGDDQCSPACTADETCVEGVCVANQPPAGACDPACAAGETCVNGACVADQPAGGDATAGEAFYTANGCDGCHLADGTGSIGPNIVGKNAARVLEVLTVVGAHGFGPNLPDTTQQDADDVAAFLGSL